MSSRLDYTKLSPHLYSAQYALDRHVAESSLEKPLLDLVRIRVSQLNGCLFCLDMHSKEAHLHGERPLRLHHLPLWHESALFSDKEKAALEWAELLTRIPPHGISDADYKRIAAHFTEAELSDLTFAVATINAWNRLGVAFLSTPGSLDKMLGLDKAGLAA